MNEQERLEAVMKLIDLRRQHHDVAQMTSIVCAREGVGSIGELGRAKPEVLDDLYEQALAMVGLDEELAQYIEIRGSRKDGETI